MPLFHSYDAWRLLFSFKWKSIMPCDRKLSFKEQTQVALFVLIQRQRTFCGKGWRWREHAPVWQYFIYGFMMSIYNGVRNTGNGSMVLNTGFVKAGSLFALPLDPAANLTTGGRAWIESSQMLEQKKSCLSSQGGYRSELECRLKNDASQFV